MVLNVEGLLSRWCNELGFGDWDLGRLKNLFACVVALTSTSGLGGFAQTPGGLSAEQLAAVDFLYEDARVADAQAETVFSKWLLSDEDEISALLLLSACTDQAYGNALFSDTLESEVQLLHAQAIAAAEQVQQLESELHAHALASTRHLEVRQSILIAQFAVSKLVSYELGFRKGMGLYEVEQFSAYEEYCL